MELDYYNTENIVQATSSKPTIRINVKAGLFSFSKAAIEKMGWSDQKFGFAYEAKTKTWYVYFDPKGFALRIKDKKAKYITYSFNSKGMQEKITQEIKNYLIGAETQYAGTFYFPLIG